MRSLAVLGTGSDVGKSIVTTALCRLLRDRGHRVAPYKAQNMSNNAGVTPDGAEIGRAQIVQAEAAGAIPCADHNPVLIKPNTDRESQIVVLGKAIGNRDAWAYFSDTGALREVAYGALDRLRSTHDLVVAEGAGSCAEVNLRKRDFVNFDVAHRGDMAVLLVADIHRGGVFGQVVGTLACLDERDRARVAGVVINRFRGDIRLFDDGRAWLAERTGLPVLGVIPWLPAMDVDAEDALPLDVPVDPAPTPKGARIRVGVVRLPHIANFTDFAPFARHGETELHWLARPRDLTPYDLVILPGTKNTRYDLGWLRETGWEAPLRAYEGALVGVCGGYQMLGRSVADPHGVEGPPGVTPGLGLLDVETEMAKDKRLHRSAGTLHGEEVDGYEIHVGVTRRSGAGVVQLHTRDGAPCDDVDGAVSGRVWGTYLHGIFDAPRALAAVLAPVRPDVDLSAMRAAPSARAVREAAYDRLAAHVATHLDLDALDRILAG